MVHVVCPKILCNLCPTDIFINLSFGYGRQMLTVDRGVSGDMW